MKKWILLIATLLCASTQALAQDSSRQQKAEALVKKAAAYIQEKGNDAALKEFNNPQGKFVDGEFYIFAYSMKNICLAMPSKPALVGKDFSEITDANGKQFFLEFHKVLDSKAGAGWVDYKWNNPVTNKIQDKMSYVMKIEGQDIFIGCGFYK